MTIFDIWVSGCHVTAEDWYTADTVYVNVRRYRPGSAISRPSSEKAFLLTVDDLQRVRDYRHTIAEHLVFRDEVRDANGRLVPLKLSTPA